MISSGADGVQLSYFNAKLKLVIGGAPVGADQMTGLISWEVETVVGRADSVEVRFQIPMDSQGTPRDIPAAWKPGAALKLDAANVPIFDGEITSVDLEGSLSGLTTIVLLAFDKRHRLYRHETVKVLKDVTISDIVTQVLQGTGVQAGAHSTLPSTKFPHHLHQGTAGDYLDRLCQELGLWCVAESGGRVALKSPKDLTEVAGTITAGIEIRDFRFRQTTSGDRNSAKVRGWDPKTKKEILGAATRSGEMPPGGVVQGPNGQTAFSSNAEMRHERYVPAQNDATAIAKGVLSQNIDAGMQLDATLTFLPKIAAGKLIEVKGVVARFAGKYRVTSARHTYDLEEGNRTTITCRGSDDVTLTGLLGSAVVQGQAVAGRRDDHLDGVYPGIVKKVKSVTAEGAIGANGAAGEVQVALPWLDDNYLSPWMRVVTVGGGKNRGFFVLPEVDDEVLVAFEGGDPRRGYVLGGLYNGKDAAPRANAKLTDGSVIQERVWRSRTGHEIVLGDKSGEEHILIVDKTGKNSVKIDSKDNKITVLCDGDVDVTAKGAVKVDAQKAVTIKTIDDVTIEGKNITIKATANLDLKATANATMEGTAGAAVKGAKVDVNAQGPATVKGNPIMLN